MFIEKEEKINLKSQMGNESWAYSAAWLHGRYNTDHILIMTQSQDDCVVIQHLLLVLAWYCGSHWTNGHHMRYYLSDILVFSLIL